VTAPLVALLALSPEPPPPQAVRSAAKARVDHPTRWRLIVVVFAVCGRMPGLRPASTACRDGGLSVRALPKRRPADRMQRGLQMLTRRPARAIQKAGTHDPAMSSVAVKLALIEPRPRRWRWPCIRSSAACPRPYRHGARQCRGRCLARLQKRLPAQDRNAHHGIL